MEISKNRKGVFFSTDALIALVIILFIVVVARQLSQYVPADSDVHSDILAALSTLKVSELDDATVQSMILSGEIRDANKSLLEQIGEFYVYDIDKAKLLASIALDNIETNENVGLWYGNELVYSKNRSAFEEARDVDVARQVISGIKAGKNITGFSSRASLSSDYRTNYFYFGGYVGDGNVSIIIDYRGNITDEAEMELAINTSNGFFEFVVNGISMGNYATSPSPYEPVRYIFNTSVFSPGKNTLEFKGPSLYIAGGFVKIAYRGEVQFGAQNNTYYFPGINGLINLYDGFFVPENLSAMEIMLHLNTNYTLLLNVGNVSIYNSSTNGEANVTFDNAFLSSRLDYTALEGKTVPLRLGLENASFTGIIQKIDVFSVTDLSGSMSDNCGSSFYCSEITCSQIGCNDADGCKICDSKEANYLLVDFILNTTGNRVGLAPYETIARDTDYHALSNDSTSLINEISGWDADGDTCICCGIDRAIKGFIEGRNTQLVLFYNFNSNLEDYAKVGYDGTAINGPTYVSGRAGNGMNFDGVNDYVSTYNVKVDDEGTIAFWFKPDNNFGPSSSTSQGIWSKYRDNSNEAIITLKGSDFTGGGGGVGSLSVKMEYGGGVTQIGTGKNSWQSNTWYHVALTWGGGSTRIYVDGALNATISTSRNLDFWANNTVGMARYDTSNLASPRYFDGTLDDFRIYNVALSQSEIQDLMRVNAVCQNGDVESDEACDDGNNATEDGCNQQCGIEADRYKSAIVMSDGEAKRACTGNYADSIDAQEAIDLSREACSVYGIVVHSVGFDVSSFGESTLTSIAHNGCGGRYSYSDTTNLTEVYRQIAEVILTEYVEQTLASSGGLLNTRLYPDSYIKFDYNEPTYPYGLVITAESNFDDEKGGTFLIPDGATPLLTRIVSYSGPRWTSEVKINNNSVFDLDDYSIKYTLLGDPYQVSSFDSNVHVGLNYANVSTGGSALNQTSGSSANKILFTIARNASSYSKIVAVASGCIWNVEMEDGSNVDGLAIPTSYVGGNRCYYNSSSPSPSPPGTYGIIDDENDAYQLAVLNLLRELDLDIDGKSDVTFTSQDLEINLDEFAGIPFAYYTEAEVRRWF